MDDADSLRADVARLRGELAIAQGRLQASHDIIGEQAACLRAREPYVQHKLDCDHWMLMPGGADGPCTCGFDALGEVRSIDVRDTARVDFLQRLSDAAKRKGYMWDTVPFSTETGTVREQLDAGIALETERNAK